MNQRQLMAFRATMMLGSVTAAARQLNVSQPAVSRLIADLEASLGFALFVRQAARLTATPEAQEFYAEVDVMFSGLDRLSRVAGEIRSLSRATVRLATLPTLSFGVVPRAVFRFQQAHPDARVLQDVQTSARVVEMVASRQVELGLAQSHGHRSDLSVLRSWRMRCVCVMRPDHPLAEARVLTPKELANHALILLARHTISASYIINAFADHGIAPRIAAESQPSFAAGQLAAAGCGVAIIDELTARSMGDQVRSVPFWPEVPFAVHLLKAEDVPLSRGAEKFVHEINMMMDEALGLIPGAEHNKTV